MQDPNHQKQSENYRQPKADNNIPGFTSEGWLCRRMEAAALLTTEFRCRKHSLSSTFQENKISSKAQPSS